MKTYFPIRSLVICLCSLTLTLSVFAQGVEVIKANPGRQNVRFIHYDHQFLFMARNYGRKQNQTEPGLFVHSKKHGFWLQITKISTKGGKFGRSWSPDPKENLLLRISVSWDHSGLADRPFAVIPLRTSGSICFPEEVEFDDQKQRYVLRFLTSSGIESAATTLYIDLAELTLQFDKHST